MDVHENEAAREIRRAATSATRCVSTADGTKSVRFEKFQKVIAMRGDKPRMIKQEERRKCLSR